MRETNSVLPLLFGLILTGSALAQPFPIDPLVVEGDVVPGVGTVVSINNLVVNDNGDWIVEADTNHPNTDADVVLIKNGSVFLREGDPLPAPAGATLDIFDSLTLNANDDSAWNFGLTGPPSGEDSGLYFGTTLVVQEGEATTAPEFTPGTPYLGFFDVKLNDANLMSVLASFDDPEIASGVDQGLLRLQTDPGGALLFESVQAKEGDILPGQTQPIEDFGTGPHESDLNNAGQLLYFADLAGSSVSDGVIYLDEAKLAQESSLSPIPFRRYELLSSRGMSLNNHGDSVFKANIEGDTTTDELIVKNGAKFVQEGDTLPAIAPFVFAGTSPFGLSAGPVYVDDSRNVLWFGDWDAATNDTGLFLNSLLLAQEGVTMIGFQPIESFYAGSDGFAISPNGRFVVFEANLPGSVNGAFLIEITAPSPVPDGAVVAGAQAGASRNPNGTDVDVTWDAASCPADDYNLLFGDLGSVSALGYSGAACNLGTGGTASFTPPPGDVFWIVVGVDAFNRESSHGFDSSGTPRDASAEGLCGVTIQINASDCPV